MSLSKLRQIVTLAGLAVATLASGCGPTGREPKFDPIDDQTGFVGAELSITVRASDPDADALTFDFSAPEIPDLGSRATIRPYGTDGSTAVFRWTPIAKDVGSWLIDFQVTDGGVTITETISVEIKAAVGSNESPAFLRPLGNSVSLDLAMKKCVDLDIEIGDNDDARVDIAAEPQIIEGSQLTVTGDKTAKWHWCPSTAQVAAQDRYALNLSADDGNSPRSLKSVLILIVKEPVTGCAGAAPTVTHSAMNASTLAPVTIGAQIADDVGLKSSPVLYYATTPPANPPNLSAMTLVAATKDSGDMKNGHWVATVPNPVADLASGATATLYYVWVAVDNDNSGNCTHTTQAPASGVYQATITNPGGAGNLMTCQECTSDAQCGGAADNCITVGAGKYCGKGCAMDSDCPTNYQCSTAALTSVNGAMARQCVPKTGSCTMVTPPTCTDDSKEPNDSLAAAAGKPPLAVATPLDLQMCPAPGGSGVNEDWFRIVVPDEDAEITVNLTGGAETDLDLQLLTAGAAPVDVSSATGSTETVSGCLSPGTYYVRVYSPATAPKATAYRLSYTGVNKSCAPPPTCTDDSLEPNDSFDDALFLLPDLFDKDGETGLQICAGDDDLFILELKKDQILYASLTFNQPSPSPAGDLDFHLYYKGSDLLPCDEFECVGGSLDSNEYFELKILEDGYYYLAVHGYQGAENRYDICVSLKPNQCPKYP